MAQLPDFTLSDCNGVSHHLYADLAAGNAVILDFGAPSCSPCQIETPYVQLLNKQYCSGGLHVKIYGMYIDTGATEAQQITDGLSYAAEFNLTYPIFTNLGTYPNGIEYRYMNIYDTLDDIPLFLIIKPDTSNPANSHVTVSGGAINNLNVVLGQILNADGYPFSGPLITATPTCCSAPPYSATLSSNLLLGNHWSTGDTTTAVTVHSSGAYMLTINNGTCINTDTQYIQFNPVPVAGTVAISTDTMCYGGPVFLTYTPGNIDTSFNVTWQSSTDSLSWNYTYPGGNALGIRQSYSSGTQYFRVQLSAGTWPYDTCLSCVAYSNVVKLTATNQQPDSATGYAYLAGTGYTTDTVICTQSPFTLLYAGDTLPFAWDYYYNYGDWYLLSNDMGAYTTSVNQLNVYDGSFQFEAVVPHLTCYSISNQVGVTSAYCNFCLHDTLPVIWQTGDTLQTQSFKAYQWLIDGAPIAGDSAQRIIINQNGNYQVVVTHANPCTDTSLVYNVTGVGVQNTVVRLQVTIYPVPTTGKLIIQPQNFNPQTITIYDDTGRLISTLPFKNETNISTLSNGVYFMEVTGTEGVVRRRVVKM